MFWKTLWRTSLILFCALVLLGAQKALAQTQTIIEPRADNFIFYVDNSGSMMFDYEAAGEDKIKVARDLLLTINDELPELDADFGVYTYGPYKEYRPATPYDRQDMTRAFEAIPDDFEIFGRRTPMGQDLIKVDERISGLQGDIAVVVLTDGESNIGPRPAGVMQDMYQRYGDRICFHFISVAQTAGEKALVEELAGINPCTVKIDAADLQKDFARADFIQDVFYTTREVSVAPPVEPEPEIAPVVEPEPEEVIVFSNVQFDFDRAEIKPQYAEILREAARQIRDREDPRVIVEGHTCNIGPAEYNMGLSERRAQAVADFLVEQNVDRNAIETRGYGLTRPAYDNDTREGRSLNRRVEMRLE